MAWSTDAASLYIRTDRGLWRATPPLREAHRSPRSAPTPPQADSGLHNLFNGSPPFARVVPCSTGGLCIIGPKRDTTPLAPAGRDALRWGTDSVAWFEKDGIVVRSLGPGSAREIGWKEGPKHPRDGTYSAGPPAH